MKRFAFYLLSLLALSSCRATRPAPEPPRDYSRAEGTPYAPHAPRAPDSVVVQPHRSLLDRLTGRTPTPLSYKEGVPTRIGKKAAITIYNGNATVTTNTAAKNAAAGTGATAVAKADAPVATGAGDATDLARAQASANIKGDGNTSTPTNTAPEAPGTLAVIADNLTGPLGWVLGIGAGLALIVFLIRRRAASNLT